MPTIQHGVLINNLPTKLRTAVKADTLVPVVIGVAPVHKLHNGSLMVNVPFLAQDFDSTILALGDVNHTNARLKLWTLSQFVYACFTLYNAYAKPAPILINVANPAVHNTVVTATSMPVVNGIVTVADADVIYDSVTVATTGGSPITYVRDTDFTLSYDANENLLITIIRSSPPANLSVGYNKMDLSKVTPTHILGGVDGTTGKRTGMELINEVFTDVDVVPSLLLTPGYFNSAIASAGAAKMQLVEGRFKGRFLADLPCGVVTSIQNADAGMSQYTLSDPRQHVFWPFFTNAGLELYPSIVGALQYGAVVQQNYANIPYGGASNTVIPIDGMTLGNGVQFKQTEADANILNGLGIVTATLYRGGWQLWGDWTAAVRQSSDPMLELIAPGLMQDWLDNTIVLTSRQFVDKPANIQGIEMVLDTIGLLLNSLQQQGAIDYGTIDFLRSENPQENLLLGVVNFRVTVGFILPMTSLVFNVVYDPNSVFTLFNAISSVAVDNVTGTNSNL